MSKTKIQSILVLMCFLLNIIGFSFPVNISANNAIEDKSEKLQNLSLTSESETNLEKNISNKLPYVEGDIIVKYKKGKSNSFSKKTSELEKKGFKVETKSLGGELKNFKASNKTTKQMIDELSIDPNIEYIQPNFIYNLQDFSPNDSQYSKQWGLNNTAQNINGVNGTSDMDIDWPEAMNIFTGTTNGTGNIVAIIDSGVDYNHEDLKNKLWDGNNCLDENGNFLGGCKYGYNYYDLDKDPLDTDGHGTHVAGIIAGELNNNIGISGVNPNTKIMAIKGIGTFGTTTDVIKSINFAINNGAKVINASWGGYYLTGQTCSEGVTPSFDLSLYNAIKDFGNKGGLFIAAAGNSANNQNDPTKRIFPAGFGEDLNCGNLSLKGLDNIISVASINNNGGLSYFSDYGSGYVDIGAPGENIYSSYIDETPSILLNGDNYSYSATGTTLPNYLTGAVGNWTINDTLWPGEYYDIYPDGKNPYSSGSDFKIDSIPFNLSSITNSNVYLKYSTECNLPSNNNGSDYLSLLFSKDGVNFTEFKRYDNNGYDFNIDTLEIPSDYLTNNFKFRFNWITGTDNNVAMGGCNINPKIYLYYYNNNIYEFVSGTSMAAPHVTGLVSLAWGYRQDLSNIDIKNAILQSGDNINSLSGKTITGKKINAYNTLLNLSPVGNIENFTMYEDETKQTINIDLSLTPNVYLEWNDNINPYTLSGYVLNITNGSGTNVFSGVTKNNFFTGVTINKSGIYNFSLYKQLLNNNTGGLVSLDNMLFDLNPTGNISFSSGAYTNSQNTKLNINSNKSGIYTLTGDVLNALTGSILTGSTLDINLTSGDGIKNISVEITDEFSNKSSLTGSIILDSVSPVIENLSINDQDKFLTGTLTITGVVNDLHNDNLKINNIDTTISGTGYFSKEISLNAGNNIINFKATDKAGNAYTGSKNIIRIGNKPLVNTNISFGKVKFNLEKEFNGTGIVLFGTGNLNNTLTGNTLTGETLEVNVLPQTTYYYKAFFINNGFESESSTGSFTTPFFIDSTINSQVNLTGSTNIIDASNSGVTFSQTGVINLKTDEQNYITIDTNGLVISTVNGTWDGTIKSPEKVTGTGNISVSGYSRINDLTFKVGSDIDGLVFSGGKVEVSIFVGTTYNNKTLKIYRSGDNQQNFEYLTDCKVSEGICKFQTNKFSYFTFLEQTKKSSSGGGGGGGGGGGSYSNVLYTCSTAQLKCVNGKFELIDGQKCTGGNLAKSCDATNLVLPLNLEKKVYDYKNYQLVKYEGYSLSDKIEKIAKFIIDYKKLDDSFKKSFVNNLNNFLIAKYELSSSTEKNAKLKANYNKQVILLKNSIIKLDKLLKSKTKK